VPAVSSQLVVAKFAAANGARMWSKDAWPYGNLHALAIDSSGDAYVTGQIDGGSDLGTGALAGAGQKTVMFIAKLSGADAGTTWSRAYPRAANTSGPFSTGIVLDGAAHLLVSGVTDDTTFEPDFPKMQHTFVAELDVATGDALDGWGFSGTMDTNLAVGPFGEHCVLGTAWGVNLGSGTVSGETVFASLP
jgi:hypothetical protein